MYVPAVCRRSPDDGTHRRILHRDLKSLRHLRVIADWLWHGISGFDPGGTLRY